MRVIDLLTPVSGLYGAAVAARLSLYRNGVFAVRRATRPVISVGNIAAGGTGKTPFVRWLAGELVRRGLRPSILTRGYGRSSRGQVLVSDGAGAVTSVAASGDEAAVLAHALPTVPIVADARRTEAAARAEKLEPPVAVHLLDDGFSHVELARDVDIVLLDATDPAAGGALLPRGRLREPFAALARADIIVVTKTEQAGEGPALELAKRFAPGLPVFRACTEVVGIADAQGASVAPADLPGATLVAVAGIAHPESFWRTLSGLGIEPAARLAFPDHAAYGDFRVGRILRAAEETGATAVVTTEKDAVKLAGHLPLPLYAVAVEARVVETGFVSEVVSRLGRSPS